MNASTFACVGRARTARSALTTKRERAVSSIALNSVLFYQQRSNDTSFSELCTASVVCFYCKIYAPGLYLETRVHTRENNTTNTRKSPLPKVAASKLHLGRETSMHNAHARRHKNERRTKETLILLAATNAKIKQFHLKFLFAVAT